METIIKNVIETIERLPAKYRDVAFPILFEHELLEVRRIERKDDSLAFRRRK